MKKKLTITLDEAVYHGLHQVIGRRRISRFIENLVKPYVVEQYFEAAYQQMSEDIKREQEALDWAEETLLDVEGINLGITASEILQAIQEGRRKDL